MPDQDKALDFHGMAGHLIRRLHQISTQVFGAHARAAGFDLTPVQFAAMAAIRANPGIDQATVAAQIAYDRATIGGVIDRLSAKGLVTREVSETDRRARVLTLTEEGARQIAALATVVESFQPEILQGLNATERETFLALARKAAYGETS